VSARPAPSRPQPTAAPEAAAGGPPAPPRLSSIAPTTAPGGDAASAVPPAPADDEPAPVVEPAVEAPTAEAPSDPNGALDLGPVLALWPAVLEALKSSSRVAHTLAEGAVPISRSARMLTLAHPDKVRMGILRSNKGHLELLRLAVLDVLRLDVEVDLVLDPGRAGASEPAGAPEPVEQVPAPEEPSGPSARERAAAAVAEEQATHVAPEADVVSDDDDDVDDSGLSGLALVQRELGGTVMTEYDNG
jgi:DNA polymerase-3 subunit gamma/tau